MINSFRLYKTLAVILFLFASSCKHPIPELPVNPAPGGGTTGNVSVTCSADTVYFQQQILPIFISNCSQSGCHDAASHQERVILTSYSTIISTGRITPFNPFSGEVYQRINTSSYGDKMPPPPYSALTLDQKNAIYKWIMQGAKNNSCMESCDSTTYSYSAAIKPLINNYCQGCHTATGASGGVDLSTYSGVKAKVNDGRLWGAITQLPGYVAMPQNGQKLTDCQLTQFRKWIAAGALNN